MDHRLLLIKYITHVGDREGSIFLSEFNFTKIRDNRYKTNLGDTIFTEEEIDELHKLSILQVLTP